MYSLDVNFLKDRQVLEDPKKTTQGQSPGLAIGKNLPILIGLGVLVLLPATTAGLLLVLNSQTAKTQENIKNLEAEMTALAGQNKSIQELEQQAATINEETQAIVGVFNQIKPWSAILQDIRDRIPAGVQIETIKQQEAKGAASTAQGATPTPASVEISIAGMARSYDDVNDLILSLQKSNFLNAQKTVLTSAETVDFPVEELNEDEREALERQIQQGIYPGIPKGANINLVSLKILITSPKLSSMNLKPN
ncbi:fimbrial protein [Candidatus Gracilibacteria bacterium]|nr:fimbrial protein [Candidatus Gracilibacteria bacterium]